jgi:four helix bundle protein
MMVPKEFVQFLNISRRSLFADASMLLVVEKLRLVDADKVNELLAECDLLSHKLTNFSRTL